MFTESIEEKYKELLRQRVALEGDWSLQKRQQEEALGKAKKRASQYLLLLLLLPLTTLICHRRKEAAVLTAYENQILAQKDSLRNLREDVRFLGKTKVKQLKYVIKPGDMLSILGELFFNDREAGIQIGKDNGIVTSEQMANLRVGDTLNIIFR